MRSDVFTAAGNSHPVCQDYSRAGKDFVVVSDGCSSSPDSDLGARCLVLSAHEMLSNPPAAYSEDFLIGAAKAKAVNLGTPKCLDATLLFAHKRGSFVIFEMWGDGVMGYRLKSGDVVFLKREYPDNCPFYLSYLLNEERMRNFRVGPPPTMTKVTIASGGMITEEKGAWEPRMMVTPSGHGVGLAVPTSEADLFFVATDGLSSFLETVQTQTSRTQESVQLTKVLMEFLAFKKMGGNFVERRSRRVLKQFSKVGWEPYDDLSLGVLAKE